MQINNVDVYIIGDPVNIVDDVACAHQKMVQQITADEAIPAAVPSNSSWKPLGTLPVKPN